MTNSDLKYWIAISRIGKIGAVRFKKLYNFFPDMKIAWLESDYTDLTEAGLEDSLAQEFIIKRKQIDPDHELALLHQEQIQAFTVIDEKYPKLLKEIYCPPPVLYYKGSINTINEYAIAVVGARKMSAYGKQVTEEIVRDLATNQLTIISGLALGIDAQAHVTALQNKTQTIAVLGSGLDQQNIYPASNRYLADKILQNNGIILSEYPIGTLPQKHNFPARNRIISGLSLGTLIIEAGETSGALITAKFALEQNREVFAVPGNINASNSQGTNRLIQQGANLVFCANDILEVLNLQQIAEFKNNRQVLPDNDQEEKILTYLSKEPIHIDQLAKLTKLPTSKINATLTLMQLKGKLKNLGNQLYIIN